MNLAMGVHRRFDATRTRPRKSQNAVSEFVTSSGEAERIGATGAIWANAVSSLTLDRG